jgi:predicted amidohydrolase
LTARAIENQCYVAGINRVGSDPGYSYPGASVCLDWNGDALAETGSELGVTTAVIKPDELHAYRTALPFLQSLNL